MKPLSGVTFGSVDPCRFGFFFLLACLLVAGLSFLFSFFLPNCHHKETLVRDVPNPKEGPNFDPQIEHNPGASTRRVTSVLYRICDAYVQASTYGTKSSSAAGGRGATSASTGIQSNVSLIFWLILERICMYRYMCTLKNTYMSAITTIDYIPCFFGLVLFLLVRTSRNFWLQIWQT